MSFSERKIVLLNALGFFWTDVFLDDDFVDAYSKTLAIQYNDLDTLVSNIPEVKSRREIPVFDIEDYRIFIFDERNLDRDAHKYGDEGLAYGGGALYGSQLSGDLDKYSFPIDEDLTPQYLSSTPFAEDQILQNDVDYVIENGRIIFNENPLNLPNVLKNVVTIPGDPNQYFSFALWGFKTDIDRQNIQSFYGAIGGVTGISSEEYKEAMNIAWELRVDGASVANLTKVLSLATNVDYVNQDGAVKSIFNEGNSVCVETDNAVYCAPLGTPVLVGPCASIKVADIIFDTFEIFDATVDVPFEFFPELLLDTSHTTDLLDSIILPNEYVDVIQDPSTAEYSFQIGGTAVDKETFFTQLNTDVDSASFFDALALKYGRVPTKINPLHEVQDLIFGADAFFIKIKAGTADREFLGQLLAVFKATLSAGSTFFLFDELTAANETYSMTNASESATIFTAVVGTETGVSATEYANVGQVVI